MPVSTHLDFDEPRQPTLATVDRRDVDGNDLVRVAVLDPFNLRRSAGRGFGCDRVGEDEPARPGRGVPASAHRALTSMLPTSNARCGDEKPQQGRHEQDQEPDHVSRERLVSERAIY